MTHRIWAHRIGARPKVTRRAMLAMGGAALLAGCGQREGGRGWFGRRNAPETLEPEGGFPTATVDARPLAPRVETMSVEPTTGGVIVRAGAVMPSQGYWDADLVPAPGDNPRDGVFRFDLRAWPPAEPATAVIGPPRSREITAAAFLSRGDLENVTSIAVVAQAGAISRRP